MPLCPVCYKEGRDWNEVAMHLTSIAKDSEPEHVMWLNRNISISEMDTAEVTTHLKDLFTMNRGLLNWIRDTFIQRFYGLKPHPFMVAMQRPTRSVLLGYVIEHQHFLRNWVKVLSTVIQRADDDEVIMYEIENISTEFSGYAGRPSHYELLLRMGESLGMKRGEILGFRPLPSTSWSINLWRSIAERRNWVETMAAMHSLELGADRSLRRYGATVGYFNSSVLESGEYTSQTKEFLREGYEADESHAGRALTLVEGHSHGAEEAVQVTVLRSLEALSVYLNARLERASLLEAGNQQGASSN